MQLLEYSNHTHSDRGECVQVSFPYHELYLKYGWEELARSELSPSKSHYIRALLKKELNKLQDQKKCLAAA